MNPTRLEQAAATSEAMITMLGIHATLQQTRDSISEEDRDQAQAIINQMLETQWALMGALGMAAEA